ncbi:hypothetical protein ABK040_006672 [Willaertia magna]
MIKASTVSGLSHKASTINSFLKTTRTIRQFHKSLINKSFFNLSAKDISGKVIPFNSFNKNVCLVINLDEKALLHVKESLQTHPYISQLSELRELFEQYKHDGFTVLAFPCGTTDMIISDEHSKVEELKELEDKTYKELKTPDEHEAHYKARLKHAVQKTFDCHFPLMDRVHINGIHEHNVFNYLKNRAEELEKKIVKDPKALKNEDFSIVEMFTKFLINRKGEVVARFEKDTEPIQLKPIIEQLLAESVYQ